MTENIWSRFTSIRWIDGRKRNVIVDICGNIINKNPTKEELKGLKIELSRKELSKEENKEYLLEFLRYFYKKEARVPMMGDFINNSRYPSGKIYQMIFGSWNNAIKEARLETNYPKKGQSYTDEGLLRYLRQFYEENGRVPEARDFIGNPNYPGYSVYQLRFGRWNNAIIEAGLWPNKAGTKEKYTDEELLESLRRFEREERRIPEMSDFYNNPKYPGPSTHIRRFGRWNNALKLAGLQIDAFTNCTDEELLECLIQFYEENGRPPARREFVDNPKYPGFYIYVRRFGSWENALKQACINTDSMVKKGIIETENQKARLGEIFIKEHFIEKSIDMSGENCNSPFDGICPNGQIYDVKSSKLQRDYWQFGLDNSHKDEIEWYYLLAFNEDYSELLYVWRVLAWEFMGSIEKGFLHIGINDNREYNIENMKQYEITEKFMLPFKN